MSLIGQLSHKINEFRFENVLDESNRRVRIYPLWDYYKITNLQCTKNCVLTYLISTPDAG